MIEDILPAAALVFIVVVAAMFGVALKRGRVVQAVNERIEANQRRTIEMGERQIALSERNAAAMERIAAALERRGE